MWWKFCAEFVVTKSVKVRLFPLTRMPPRYMQNICIKLKGEVGMTATPP